MTLLPMTVPVAVNGFGLLLCGLGVSWTLPAVVGFAVNQAVPEAASAVGGILNSTRQIGATVAAASQAPP